MMTGESWRWHPGAKLHDKLKQGTKELPSLEIDDHVMLQNQLGNKPKRWDK
jgi:hypothetical protein